MTTCTLSCWGASVPRKNIINWFNVNPVPTFAPSNFFKRFFIKQELNTSNTGRTRGKQCLDRNKLIGLKALAFAKFSLESSERKEKIWLAIKGKINTKYWVSKLLAFRAKLASLLLFLLRGQWHPTSKAVLGMTCTLFTPPLEWKS